MRTGDASFMVAAAAVEGADTYLSVAESGAGTALPAAGKDTSKKYSVLFKRRRMV
jgi:hypothetical protein